MASQDAASSWLTITRDNAELSMQIVYWAHSYRDEDASVNKYFGVLIEKASKNVNSSKL